MRLLKELYLYLTHLFYTLHFPLLLFQILLMFLSSLVNAANEPLQVTLMSHAILMMLARGSIVCNVDVAVLAEVLFLRDPIFAHGSS